MNIHDQNLIPSTVVIHDIMEDFNIQSMDFITRVPSWICQCLVDLNIQQYYIEVADRLEFEEYKCKLPEGCKEIRTVIINRHRALYSSNPAPITNDNMQFIPLAVSFPVGYLTMDNVVFDISQLISDPIYTYSINGTWLHLNVCRGELGLIYQRLPFVIDEVLKINVPLIPNNEILKEAIKNFVMTRILQRGYRHPVLNLKENNPFTNPSLKYDSEKIKVRNACNKLNIDKREDCSRSLMNFFDLKNHYVN